ncbi:MarR family winged helix-turn-helix transcriptional regulator [Phreatobacter aquaticus]|nr:MarR family winged helix-turn-helix transcriptional regulator [Phreatobacter aquaticus]
MVTPSRKPRVAADAKDGAETLDFGMLPGLVGYVLRRAQLRVFEDFIRSFEPLALRPAQFSALLLIEANPGRSQREIAAGLGIQRPNFVAMMDEFEARGLARRTRSEVDRRSHALMLTPAGTDLLVRAKAVVAEHEARATAGLSEPDRLRLLALLKAM